MSTLGPVTANTLSPDPIQETTIPITTLPNCNVFVNGKGYYDEKPVSNLFGTFFGTIGLYISLTISFLLVISVFFSYRSSGFGFLTIFTSFFLSVIISSIVNNIITIKKAKDSRSENCKSSAPISTTNIPVSA